MAAALKGIEARIRNCIRKLAPERDWSEFIGCAMHHESWHSDPLEQRTELCALGVWNSVEVQECLFRQIGISPIALFDEFLCSWF